MPGQASCSGPVRWRAQRSVITPVAMQMVASIALGRGGKGFVGRITSEKEAVYRFVPVAAFVVPLTD